MNENYLWKSTHLTVYFDKNFHRQTGSKRFRKRNIHCFRRTWIRAILNVMGIILIGILILTWFLLSRPLDTLTNAAIVEMIVFLPFLLIGYLMESQYVHYFSIIKYRYSILNEYLEAVVCENKCDNGKYLRSDL